MRPLSGKSCTWRGVITSPLLEISVLITGASASTVTVSLKLMPGTRPSETWSVMEAPTSVLMDVLRVWQTWVPFSSDLLQEGEVVVQ